MEAVGVGVAEELTVEMCTAVGEQLRASGDSSAAAAATAGRQKPEMRVVGDEVQVSHSTRRTHSATCIEPQRRSSVKALRQQT